MLLSDYLTDRGKRMFALAFGRQQGRAPADVADSEYQRLMANFVTNGLDSREVVSQGTRERIAVACLTALYRPDELRAHIGTALRLHPPEQVKKAIVQAGVDGGFPATMSALRNFVDVQNRVRRPG